ncbi:O-methyltransferase [Neofusicoccum parvum]|uniref:O-methyltransferase n=2 Tax=Neofusicoccum parvum TaxID=310453 RepID=A0ACB5S060_9PEZI|nr:putative o-methyltransferase protein [Neofusicoccum parvum UCRNP2]GME26164.1 O-methyltransferase [Neofusicoccum parvum]GME54284.1 O-methyltransferase [Neofusicoccum parvum]
MSAPAATPESIATRTASIEEGIARIAAAAESFAETSRKNLGDTSKDWETKEAQNGLAVEIKKLLLAAQGPLGAMFDQVQVPVSLMRNATVAGPLAEVDEETYAQTPYSAPYKSPEITAIVKHIMDETWPSIAFMNQYFKENGWKHPVDPTNCPYTFAHRTNGKESWAYIAQFPERQENSNRAMIAQSFDSTWSVGLYPFAEKLAETPSGDDETPLVVDVGGGVGHTSRQIRELCAGIKGRVVLQDRAEVVKDAPHIDGIVAMEHDFFSPQPIKGARIYYLRRILHDWSDPTSIQILRHLAAAMDPKSSRLVIAEQILPTKGVSAESALIDMVLMTITGGERTEKQWDVLLKQAGLKLERVWRAPGTAFGAIEATVAV